MLLKLLKLSGLFAFAGFVAYRGASYTSLHGDPRFSLLPTVMCLLLGMSLAFTGLGLIFGTDSRRLDRE